MPSNYSIVIDKVDRHEYYVRHIFRSLLSVPKSTFNTFIEKAKDDWETKIEFAERKLFQNANYRYNNTVSSGMRPKY